MMQSRGLVLIAIFWAAACGPSQQDSAFMAATDEAAVREATSKWDAANNSQNVEALLDLYQDDAVRMDANAPPSVGRAAIRAGFLQAWQTNDGTSSNEVTGVRISGDLAVSRGTFTASITPKNGSEPYEDRGTWSAVLDRQADGSWKNVWDIWNSELPARPNAPAPSWAVEHLSAWYAAYNAGDAQAVARLYWPEAIRIPPDGAGARLRGRTAIQASLAKDFRTTRFECRGGYNDVRVLGAMAIATGYDGCVATPKAGGDSQATGGRWITVLEQRGTEWLIAQETWESVPK